MIATGCDVLFARSVTSRAMCAPAAVGDLRLLRKHLRNLDAVAVTLFIAWLAYTLAHGKVPTTNFVILVLQGLQGSGKTVLCRMLKRILDPHSVVVQMLPTNIKDLAIISQSAHVQVFDNVRDLSHSLADALCVNATGGYLSNRKLYTDDAQSVLHLHGAVVLNSIHDFVSQPDLAQRCLLLQTVPLSGDDRRSEAQVFADFEADLPAIMRGLFDLVAQVFVHLSSAEVVHPERMIEFVRWLAAMEVVEGAPAGAFQAAYSETVTQGQRDTLLSHPLAAAVLEFGEEIERNWSGTPSELLVALNARTTRETQRSRGWPLNAIALSKKLIPLQAALLAQGIRLDFHRGKHRRITITRNNED